MTNAAIYEIDDSTLVPDTLEGDLYIISPDGHEASQSSGSVSGGRLTAELPGEEAISSMLVGSSVFDEEGELVPPTANIFIGLGFLLKDADGNPLGMLCYGEIETDADLDIIGRTQAIFFYSDVPVSVNVADRELYIDGAPAGWSIATFYEDADTMEMTNHRPLPAGAKWLFRP
jgi:hypothetical protein